MKPDDEKKSAGAAKPTIMATDRGFHPEDLDTGAAESPVGMVVGNYQIVSILGAGGFGTVFKARDLKLDRDVALKFLRNPLDARHLKLFEREAKALAALSKHPGIAQIHAWGEFEGLAYFALEFVPTTAADLLRKSPEGMPIATALRIAHETADAIAYAHGQGVLHRDLKPANILVEESGRAKVADFGLARLTNSGERGSGEMTLTGLTCGSPSYMSPEQANGEALDERTDVFALGVTLYELLTGRKPFDGTGEAGSVTSRRVPLLERMPHLPASLAVIVDQAMAHNRELRTHTAREFADAVGKTLSDIEGTSTRNPKSKIQNPKSHCAACHARLASNHSIAGQCAECEAPICFRCWALGKRMCSAHAPAVEAPKPAPAQPASRKARNTMACAECGKEISTRAVSALSAPPSGDKVYCTACQKRLVAVPAELPAGAVTCEQARFLETLFVRFVTDKLPEVTQWLGGDLRWKCRLVKEESSTLEPLPEGYVEQHPLKAGLEKRVAELPRNLCQRLHAEYQTRRRLRRKKRMLDVQLVCYVPLQPLLKQGYVAEPADIRELDLVLDHACGQTAREGLLLIFSPTGWKNGLPTPANTVLVAPKSACASRGGFGKTAPEQRKGLDSGSTLGSGGGFGKTAPTVATGWNFSANVPDPEMQAFVEDLFKQETRAEEIAQCVKAVLALAPGRFPLSARKIAQEAGWEPALAAEAFRAIAAEKKRYIMCDDPREGDWILDIR